MTPTPRNEQHTSRWIVVDQAGPRIVYKGTKQQCQDALQLVGPGHHIQSECTAGCYNPQTLCRYCGKRHGEK